MNKIYLVIQETAPFGESYNTIDVISCCLNEETANKKAKALSNTSIEENPYASIVYYVQSHDLHEG